MSLQWPSKKRIPWLLGALALMFFSAYSIFNFYAIGFNVGARRGIPKFATQIPKLEAEGLWWGRLGLALPFLAAFLLGFGRDEADKDFSRAEPTGRMAITYSAASHEWLDPIASYLFRLAISGLGTLGFAVLILLVLFVVFKLGIHLG